MAISPAALRQLAALGLKAAQLNGVLAILADILEEGDRDTDELSSGALRQRRYRDRHQASQGDANVTSPVTASVTVIPAGGSPDKEGVPIPDKETSPTPPKENNPYPPEEINPSSLASLANRARVNGQSLADEFAQTFWPVYPHRVGKAAALKAWPKARRKADLTTIMAGLQSYIANKPPDQHYQNPASFLNGERWNDEPAPPVSNGKISGKDTMLEILFGEQSRGPTLDLKSETKLLGK